MTKQQYEYCNNFRGIINLFVNSGEFIGGCDALFDYYKDQFNLGNPVNTRCPSCVGATLLDINQKLVNYERNLQSL